MRSAGREASKYVEAGLTPPISPASASTLIVASQSPGSLEPGALPFVASVLSSLIVSVHCSVSTGSAGICGSLPSIDLAAASTSSAAAA